MSLQQKIDAYKEQFRAKAPPQKAALMAKATEELTRSGILDSILKEGDKIPQIVLSDADGVTVDLAALNKQGNMVLTFYRGVW